MTIDGQSLIHKTREQENKIDVKFVFIEWVYVKIGFPMLKEVCADPWYVPDWIIPIYLRFW